MDKEATLQRLTAFNALLEVEKQTAREAALWRTFCIFQPEQAAQFEAACQFKQESADGR
jgi:hypothetical protein